MSDGRPNPEELLARVAEEERDRKRGKLTVFLGYSAGVGKTYTMLEDAQQRKKKGADVVVASLVTHGRKETEALTAGLESVPLKKLQYRGLSMEEMDIDAVLARNPELALVDELAHTNAAGSRHAKRYQDVEELLEAGIDVYTTLNVQHLESRNDVVAKVTGVKVRETIPDTVLDDANEIKVVDLPPKDLIQRFKEGKVYIPDQAEIALNNFFEEGNLIALREMTLRVAAEHVDEQMLEYLRARSIQGPWPTKERLLVCIGDSWELNERLIRTGKRLASELNAEWHAVYVETLATNRKLRTSGAQAMDSIELASALGATTSTTFGVSIAEEVIRYARKHHITRIIVGRPRRPLWQELLLGSVVTQLVKLAGDYDLTIMSAPISKGRKEEAGERKGPPEGDEGAAFIEPRQLKPFLYCLWMVLAVTILNLVLRSILVDVTNLVMIYLIGVVVAAVVWGLWKAVFTAVASVVVFNFAFIPPYFSFSIANSQYLITLGAFLFVGVVISLFMIRSRNYARAAQRRDDMTLTQYSLSLDLLTATTVDAVTEVLEKHIGAACGCGSVYLLPFHDDLRIVRISEGLRMDEREITAARWAFKNGLPAGKGTDTLASAELRFYPIMTSSGTLGVAGIPPRRLNTLMRYEQERMLQSFANQAGLAIERINLSERLLKQQ